MLNKQLFDQLPTPTNAVESHNRLSKSGKLDVLNDINTALEHIAREQKVYLCHMKAKLQTTKQELAKDYMRVM